MALNRGLISMADRGNHHTDTTVAWVMSVGGQPRSGFGALVLALLDSPRLHDAVFRPPGQELDSRSGENADADT